MDNPNELVAEMKEELGADVFDKLLTLFKNGQVSVAEIMQIPREELDNLHQLGRYSIVQKDYEKAENVLKMLTSVDPYQGEYWLTYGICLQNLQDFEMARFAYTTAINRNPKLLEAYVNAAECDICLKSPLFALDILKSAFLLPTKDAQDVELMQKAKKLQLIAENMEPGEFDKPETDAEMADEE